MARKPLAWLARLQVIDRLENQDKYPKADDNQDDKVAELSQRLLALKL
jgi:hypothetical protein